LPRYRLGSNIIDPGWLARAGRPHDIGLDHDVGGAADHQEMLDIVAADQDQAAAAVDGGGVDDGEARVALPSRLAPNRRTNQAVSPISARTTRNAMKNRAANGISEPNTLSNINPLRP
jgi:hypothetical protein